MINNTKLISIIIKKTQFKLITIIIKKYTYSILRRLIIIKENIILTDNYCKY